MSGVKTVIIKCDNQAVVSVLNSGKTQDVTLAAIARNIMMEAAKYDIDLQVIHILRVDKKLQIYYRDDKSLENLIRI